jgi:tetratricopeptide (TPR) repeat protein
MALIDRDIVQCRALVVDGNATSRSILVAQLRDFGVGTVAQCGRIADARAQLESQPFDVVLCEQSFNGTDYSGQQLLDDLRRHQLLPMSTVFVMITSEASYAKVTEAAESALDSYLLKPHTAAALGERLAQARRRKKVLKNIFQAIDENRFDEAARACLERFAARREFWLFAARIGAELLLHLGHHKQAQELYDAVLKAQAVPWAKLGIARAQLEGGETTKAQRTLETLISEQPTYVDAYDVMGRVHLEQGNFDDAVTIYRQAATLTPGSVGRLQKLGMLAFYLGDKDEAARSLERAVALGISSKMFDFQTLVLLAFTRFHQNDTKGLQRCGDSLAHALSRAPETRRLQRFVQVVRVLILMLFKQVAEAVQTIRELSKETADESFDVEAGCNLLSLVSQLTAGELRLDRVEDWVDAIGLRHCSSKTLTDLLVRAAATHPPFADRIKACHHRISQISEQAMAHSLAGDPGAAVRGLLEQGKATLNGKLIDTARLALQRHHDRIADAAALQASIDELRRRFANAPSKLALGDGHGRKAGGIALRAAATPTDAALPAATEAAV